DVCARMVHPYAAYRGDNTGYLAASSGWDQSIPWFEQMVSLRIVREKLGVRQSPLRALNAFAQAAPTARIWQFSSQRLDGTYPNEVFVDHPMERILQNNRPTY